MALEVGDEVSIRSLNGRHGIVRHISTKLKKYPILVDIGFGAERQFAEDDLEKVEVKSTPNPITEMERALKQIGII